MNKWQTFCQQRVPSDSSLFNELHMQQDGDALAQSFSILEQCLCAVHSGNLMRREAQLSGLLKDIFKYYLNIHHFNILYIYHIHIIFIFYILYNMYLYVIYNLLRELCQTKFQEDWLLGFYPAFPDFSALVHRLELREASPSLYHISIWHSPVVCHCSNSPFQVRTSV